jgi:hypothetical protein
VPHGTKAVTPISRLKALRRRISQAINWMNDKKASKRIGHAIHSVVVSARSLTAKTTRF